MGLTKGTYLANIIYGVAGEGFGHSSRSHLIGERLIRCGHNVLFAASGKSLSYLRQHFAEQVRAIFGLGFVYRQGRVAHFRTAVKNLLGVVEMEQINREAYRQFDKFGADLVISDFEPFTARWARSRGIPFITVDHEHLLTHCDYEPIEAGWFERITSQETVRWYCPGAAQHLVLNFFKTPAMNGRTIMCRPVVREVVKRLTPTCGEHIVYYSTHNTTRETIIAVAGAYPKERFSVYGYDINETIGNCVFKKISTDEFLSDLASCKGIIATGGFSLISECLYLNKKMLIVPIQGQYEQMVNAAYAEKLGFAVTAKQLDREIVGRYLDFIRHDGPVLEEGLCRPDNEAFFETLFATMRSVLWLSAIEATVQNGNARPAMACLNGAGI